MSKLDKIGTDKTKTPTQRSAVRFRRAARVLPTITLDAEHDTMLRSVIEPTGESVTDWVRRMIREQSAVIDQRAD